MKIKELKRQTRHNALKPLDVEPRISNNKTTGQKTYRETPKDFNNANGKSESSNIHSKLGGHTFELTEENMKLYDENLKQLEKDDKEEDDDFYTGFDDQNSDDNQRVNQGTSPQK